MRLDVLMLSRERVGGQASSVCASITFRSHAAHRQINPHERDLSRVGIGCGWVLECVRLDDESLQGGKANTIRVAWPTPYARTSD